MRLFTEAHKKNIARAKFGKSQSCSHREAISAANLGRSRRIPDGRKVHSRVQELRRDGLTISAISFQLGVSRSTVFNIVSGRHWSTKR